MGKLGPCEELYSVMCIRLVGVHTEEYRCMKNNVGEKQVSLLLKIDLNLFIILQVEAKANFQLVTPGLYWREKETALKLEDWIILGLKASQMLVL